MSRSSRGDRRPRGRAAGTPPTPAHDELRRRAELLLKDLHSTEPARAHTAAQRFTVLPWLKPATTDAAAHVLAHRDTMQRKHALEVIAREAGFADWPALTRHIAAGGAIAGLAPSRADAATDPVDAMLHRALAQIAADPTHTRRHRIRLELDLAQDTPDDTCNDGYAQVRRAMHPFAVQVGADATAVTTLRNECVVYRYLVVADVPARDLEEALQLVDMRLHGRERKILTGPAKGYSCAVCDPDEPHPDVDACRQCRAPNIEVLSPHALAPVLAEHLTPALRHLFAVEVRNESDGGVSPATLASAIDSWDQADEETLRQWCAPAGLWQEVPLEALPALDLAAESRHIEALLGICGGDTPLDALLTTAAPSTGFQIVVDKDVPIGPIATREDAIRLARALVLVRRQSATVATSSGDAVYAFDYVDSTLDPVRMHVVPPAVPTTVLGPYMVRIRETNADAATQQVREALVGVPGVVAVDFPTPTVEATLFAAEHERLYHVTCTVTVAASLYLGGSGRAWLAHRLGRATTEVTSAVQPPCPSCGHTDTTGFLPDDDDRVGHQCDRCEHVWYTAE